MGHLRRPRNSGSVPVLRRPFQRAGISGTYCVGFVLRREFLRTVSESLSRVVAVESVARDGPTACGTPVGPVRLDAASPSVMTKAYVFIPAIGIGFTIESLIADRIVSHFKSA